MASTYDHAAIERKWQDKWRAEDLYKTVEDPKKPKSYVLDMFPYPSGEGLHVGHPKGYIATDIYSRMKRMQGNVVLHPMGWDAFGLPAENFALKNKVHPRKAVEQNIANFKAQLAHIGFNYDWSREINTTDPGYYKWTQWIFLKMLEHGLAYQSNEPINWCPSCMTGLANEDLDNGVCERCGTPVVKKTLPQWVLKITDYADRLLKDLDTLAWPEHIKEAQRNWIGRSEGAEIDFLLHFKKKPEDNDRRGPHGERAQLTVFTTRPDTIYGATYLVLAPEHPWVTLAVDDQHDVLENKEEVRAYVTTAAGKTEIERSIEKKEKTGVELKGVKAIHPATKEEIPMYVADYVLGGYGTGVIMAVPAHDERDLQFAKKFNLPITQVVAPLFMAPKGGEDELHPDLPFEERDAICAIVKDSTTDKYLLLKWKKVAWHTFITGGIEAGQSAEEAARAEIEQETGYTKLRLVRDLGLLHSKFYHPPKGVNRFGHFRTLYFELEDGERQELAPGEHEKHEPLWVAPEEIEKLLTAEAQRYLWKQLQDEYAYTGDGLLVNSDEFTGKENHEARKEMIEAVGGRTVVRYKIRDWVFSRQRYWGEPIPVIHCEKDGVVPVPYEDLPVKLPEVDHYEPSGTGESPLAAISDWVNVTCPKCKGPAKRETNTMPQWAGSSWYYLRFMDPHDDEQLVSAKVEKYFAPVDVYVGGDHAVRHLIYARFWHKFLYDIAVTSTQEPFARLEFLGFILAEDGRKMSKRFENVINPNEVVESYGADAFRLYEMFMGPFENTVAWSTASIAGTARFVERVWQAQELVSDTDRAALDPLFARATKKVGEDIEHFKFNTAVSQLMILLNAIEKERNIGREQWQTFLRLLAPFAPHLTEELWAALGETESIHIASWPTYDEASLKQTEVEVVVQISGKKRGTIRIAPDASEEEALVAAKEVPAVALALGQSQPARVVYVAGKILNLIPAGS